jgi:hypothetical protein
MEVPNSIYDIYSERVRKTLARLGGTASIAVLVEEMTLPGEDWVPASEILPVIVDASDMRIDFNEARVVLD